MTGQRGDGSAAVPIDGLRQEANASDSPASQGIDATGSQGVQINVGGTHTQTNIFQLPLGPPAAAPLSGHPTGIPGKNRITTVLRQKARALAAVTAVALAGAGIVWWWIPGDAASPPSPTPSTPTPVRTAGPPIWSAKIANAPRGVYAYPGPFADPRHRKAAESFFEGDALRIVCQEQHGRVITDPSSSVQSTVWYKLDNNVWVSHLYTDLFPEGAGPPWSKIPNCRY